MAEIILAAIAQIYARSERASGNEVIIFQDSADISVAQPGLKVYMYLYKKKKKKKKKKKIYIHK